MSQLNKYVCRIVGHDWKFPKCLRCGQVQIVHVYHNGLLLKPSTDYVEDGEGSITLSQPPNNGDTIAVTVGQQGGLWGRNDFIADGGTVKFTVYSYYN